MILLNGEKLFFIRLYLTKLEKNVGTEKIEVILFFFISLILLKGLEGF